jgi:hypothetical protein
VVVARFDGPGLPEPTAADLVHFVAYDPGPDPFEPTRKHDTAEKVTVEVTIPKEVIGLTGREVARARAAHPAEARSLLTFIFLTLVAAAAGAIFLTYERSRSMEQEGRTPASETSPAPR